MIRRTANSRLVVLTPPLPHAQGDGNIRYYEIVDESPWCHYLNQYISGSPQRGLGVLTKRAVDTRRCEIYRFFKLHATKDICEPLSMIVPRKVTELEEGDDGTRFSSGRCWWHTMKEFSFEMLTSVFATLT